MTNSLCPTKADVPNIYFVVPIKHSQAHNQSPSLLIVVLFNISQFHDPLSCFLAYSRYSFSKLPPPLALQNQLSRRAAVYA